MSGNKKLIDELDFKNDVNYYLEHTWAKVKDNQVLVGITDYAQDQLGELIFIELPSVNDEFIKGDVFGQAESAKTVSSLYMPVSGKVISVNSQVEDDPEILNKDPYGEGWLLLIEPEALNEVDQLLSKEAYIQLLRER
ncbi:MAG: glycine cleavage system protein GcvH [Dehalobacterium sp.]